MAHKMSDDDLAKFYFETFDDDNDGKIETKELQDLFCALGMIPKSSSPDEGNSQRDTLRTFMEAYDKDGNNVIDKQEFVALYRNIASQCEGRSLYALFNQIDKDGNATISKDEVKEFLQSIGVNCSDEKISKIMTESDLNGDGDIRFKEFCMMCRKLNSK